jgi:hypothetical protein
MRLEDFTAMVDIPGDADTMHVEQCSTRVESGSRYSTESNEMIDNILINCVSELNLLAGNTVYFVTGGYRSSVGRSGVTFEKTDVDYEADDTHFVYRCRVMLRTAVQLQRNNSNSNTNQANTRGEAIRRILTDSRTAVCPINTGTLGFEVTMKGCFDGVPFDTTPRTDQGMGLSFNANWYSLNLGNLSHGLRKPFTVAARGEVFSLFSATNGVVGSMTMKKLTSGAADFSLLTEQDMSKARAFTVSHKEYTGWIPPMGVPLISHEGTTKFRVHKTGETDRSLKGITLIDKTIDRRCHFNGEVNFLIHGSRYSLEDGEYFFAPEQEVLQSMSVYQYDDWLLGLNEQITMTRVQSRVGFLNNFSSTSETVRSTNITPKTIRSGSPDEDSPVFTGRANTGRLR